MREGGRREKEEEGRLNGGRGERREVEACKRNIEGREKKERKAEFGLLAFPLPLSLRRLRPTSNGGVQKWKLGRNTYTLHTRLCTFGADLRAQSVLGSKNFCIGAQLEVYQEVRCWLGASASLTGQGYLKRALCYLSQGGGRTERKGRCLSISELLRKEGATLDGGGAGASTKKLDVVKLFKKLCYFCCCYS